MIKELLILSIRTDCGIQSRKNINEAYIAELTELMKSGVKLPEIDVYNDGTDVWMADGFHRIIAAVRAEKKTISANIHKGTLKDAKIHSIGANKIHGLRRTNEDKNHCVEMAMEVMPERSDRFIAEHIGVSNVMVSGIRARLLMVNSQKPEAPTRRVGSDGISRAVPARKIPPPTVERIAEVTAKVSHPIPLPPAPSPKASKEERLDENLKPIPDHLWPLWDKGEVMKGMAADVTRVANEIRKLHDASDLSILDGNGQDIVTALETAKVHLKANIPYAVCPYCMGKLSKDCRFCSGRGIVGHFRFKMVPAELRA